MLQLYWLTMFTFGTSHYYVHLCKDKFILLLGTGSQIRIWFLKQCFLSVQVKE